jgi:hypothetical protein
MASHRLADNGLARSKSSACDLPLGGGGAADRGAGAAVAGAELGTDAGPSACFPACSWRIGTLSFVWACPM